MNSVTITTLRSINYGAVLQAYSLNKVQCALGIHNILLDVPKSESVWSKVHINNTKSFFIGMMSNFCTLVRYSKRKRMFSRFEDFISSNIPLTEHVYTSCFDVENNLPNTDCFICGSDQVFTMRGGQNDLRMLNFDSGNILKFSYAASLGEYNWTSVEAQAFKSRVKDYSRISVREMQAKEYLKTQIGIECSVNIDPVFLTDKGTWGDLASERLVEDEYILCFPLLGNKNMQNVVDQLKQESGYKVVCVQTLPVKRIKADIYFWDAGPKEFLSLMKYASFIVTSSFHGTAFSIIFEKPFVTLAKEYRPERMISLLNLMGLQDRIFFEKDNLKEISIKNVPDYHFSQSVIAKEVERSKAYLLEIEEICEANSKNKEG